MPEEEVIALLVSAEERAKRAYEEYHAIDGRELGWAGRARRNVLKEEWATARALRELWEDRASEATSTPAKTIRKGM